MKKIYLLLAVLLFSASTYAQSVGINSDGSSPNPSAMLDVKSTSKGFLAPRMTASQRGSITSPVAGLLVYQTDGETGYYEYNGSSWVRNTSLWTSNLEGGIYYNSGNVGIGTATPGYKLTVQNGEIVSASDTDAGLVFTGTDGTANDMTVRYDRTNARLEFRDNLNSETRMVIKQDGNVGIGTSSPSHLLTLSGSLASYPQPVLSLDVSEWFTFSHQSGYGSLNWFAKANGTNLINTHSSVRPSQIGANDGELFFATAPTNGGGGAVSSLITRMVINPDGKVCIGTTTPHARLTIGGFGSGVLGGITMVPDNDTEGGHYMTFLNTEGTGIGSIARGYGLTVLYNESSDYRLKENVVNLDIDQAKSRLMSLRPVEYNYISDENKTVISGFLAHEMADAGFANGVTGEKDAVDKDGKPIYQAIDTKFLIPEMVKVIQEQQTEIDALKKELDEIKKLIQYKK